MKSKSVGEAAFAQTFQFFKHVDAKDQEELRDFLYKFAHNYMEAEYLRLLEQLHAIKFGQKSELLVRIQAMALQCFPLAMRRMSDNISKRSLRKLVTKVVREELRDAELQKIKDIHEHYSFYLNKGVAHQDEPSIADVLRAFPNSDIIDADMKHLKELYKKLVKELCSKYIGIEGKPHDYEDELAKLQLD
jgi:hypothetical protein